MGKERVNEGDQLIDALKPLLGPRHGPSPATSASVPPPRAPIVPPRRTAEPPSPPPAVPIARFILPEEPVAPPREETHPHRRTERLIYASAAIGLLLAGGIYLFGGASDASGGSSGASSSGSSGDVPVIVPLPPVAATTGRLEIGGKLPESATVIANGRRLERRAADLVAGRYELVASAPGFVSVSESVELSAGRTLVWTPHLVPEPVSIRRVAAPPRVSVPNEMERRRRELQEAIKAEAEGIRRAEERLDALDSARAAASGAAAPPAAPADSARVPVDSVAVTHVAQDSVRVTPE